MAIRVIVNRLREPQGSGRSDEREPAFGSDGSWPDSSKLRSSNDAERLELRTQG